MFIRDISDGTVRRDFDICRFQIPMNDTLLRGGFKGFANAFSDLKGLVNWNRAAPDTFCQRVPLDKFEDQETAATRLLKIIDCRDMRMIARRPNLAPNRVALIRVRKISSGSRGLQGIVGGASRTIRIRDAPPVFLTVLAPVGCGDVPENHNPDPGLPVEICPAIGLDEVICFLVF